MIYIDNLNLIFISFIKGFLDYFTTHLLFDITPEVTFYIKFSVATYNTCLLLMGIAFFINILSSLFFKNISYVNKVIKSLNISILVVLLTLLFFKLYITLKIESVLGVYFYDIKINFFKINNNINYLEHFTILSSSFSDSILILSVIVGLVCIELLGSKNLFNSFNNMNIFFLFTIFVTVMVTTNNLLIMFISFEFIFLPTVYFAYTKGYSKKIDVASEILIYWTLFGSFLVLINLAYIYHIYGTLNYLFLSQNKFSKYEIIFIFINFLIGFGIKIPLAPLHYWLLKVHVESPTAFSIYLSGFLVKSALYCLYMFLSIFNNNDIYISLTVWIIYSLIIGTLGLARQVDIKKLIAWATIQEMSFMLFFLILKQLFLVHTCILFIILHGLMSSYMFYIVDILQRRFKTRSLHFIKGLNLLFPEMTKYIWYLILLFSGFPLTVKFFIEWSVVSLLIETNRFILLIVLFFLNFLGTIFFCRIMFTIIYGSPSILKKDLELCEIQKKEKVILNMLLFLITLLFLLMFMIKWLKKKNL